MSIGMPTFISSMHTAECGQARFAGELSSSRESAAEWLKRKAYHFQPGTKGT